VAVETVTLYTIEDLQDLEGDFELDRGVLVPLNPPMPRHGRVLGRVFRKLAEFVDAHALGEVFCDCGYALERKPDTLRGPDISFVSAERGRLEDDHYPDGSPDLAIEVRSGGDRRGQIERKVGQYLDAGARLVWLLQPKQRTVLVYTLEEETVTLRPGDIPTGGDVLPGFEWPVEDIFP